MTDNGYGYGGSGNAIAKSLAATSGWNSSSQSGDIGNDQTSNNASGFTALPGGYRDYSGGYDGIGDHARFWSSTEGDISWAWGRVLSYNRSGVYRGDYGKGGGFSVRCVRDD